MTKYDKGTSRTKIFSQLNNCYKHILVNTTDIHGRLILFTLLIIKLTQSEIAEI